MTRNFTAFWRLELRLEVVALASSFADRLSVPNIVAWLTLSWWVSSSHLISSFYVAPGWSFLYRTRARRTSSVIMVYCWPFFGMEKTLRMRMWRGGTCNAVPEVDPHTNRGFFSMELPPARGYEQPRTNALTVETIMVKKGKRVCMILYVLYLLKVITCIKWYPTSSPSNITLDRFYYMYHSLCPCQ